MTELEVPFIPSTFPDTQKHLGFTNMETGTTCLSLQNSQKKYAMP